MPNLTLNKLEENLYDFVSGVLPPVISTSGVGYTTRFYGYAIQKDPIHIDALRRNECFITCENMHVLYRYETPDNSMEQEVELTYSIDILSKQTNFLLNDAYEQGLRLLANKNNTNYELFRNCGISHFDITRTTVKPERETSVFFCNLLLKINAVITFSNIKNIENAEKSGVEIFDKNKKVYEM